MWITRTESQPYHYKRVAESPSEGGGRHPLRSAARTIKSMTTCDPRCWRFSSRKVSAASTSATRLAGTEISRCPPLPLSDRRVILICPLTQLRIYTIVYHMPQKWENRNRWVFDMYIHSWYTGYIHRRTLPTLCPLGCTARPRAEVLAIVASAQREAEDARTRCPWVCYTNLARVPRRAKPDRSQRGTRKGD
jgi:hypothetical protein